MKNKGIKCILILILIISIGGIMSIIKYAPSDIQSLRARLNRIESDLKDLKLEKKVHFTAIKEGALRVLNDDDKEVARFGKVSEGLYGVKISDADGNLLVNLYDPADYVIKKPVKIEPAYDSGWLPIPAPGYYIELTHNLGYHPSFVQLWSSNESPPDLLFDESFWQCLYVGWISTTQIEINTAETTDPEFTPIFRVILFR